METSEINDFGVRNFTRVPGISDLLRTASNLQGGVPGFEYLVCRAGEGHHAQMAKWSRIRDMPIFTYEGEPLELLTRGKRIPNLAIGDVRCRISYSAAAAELMKLDPEKFSIIDLAPKKAA